MTATGWEAIASMSLPDLAMGNRIVEFAVPWSDKTLFLVPQAFHIAGLEAQRITRGRIWLVAEVLDLRKRTVSPEDELAIGQTKLLLDGTITGTSEGATVAPGPVARSPRAPDQRALAFPKRPRRRAA